VLYFDTSILVPLIVPEATTETVAALVRLQDRAQFATSQWAQVEFASMIAREVRMGRLDANAGSRANSEFESLMDRSFVMFLPNADDFDLARRYVMRFETGLRAGDALHLAIATNQRARAIYSLDNTMIKAGAKLGLPTIGLQLN
jgi:predicted nucleic acid-binding protein